jgi:thermitase
VAPHASLIPIRTNESVLLFSMRALRRAIDHAVSQGAHVISISMGGPQPGLGTRRAVQRAVEAGTTVLAAAGNEIGFVVFPAAFDEVIAVAASNIHDEPWRGSSRGPAVDITAPGQSVWRAKPETRPDGGLNFLVERGNGTSFAVATTAGVAALWVSFHGWSTLVRRYGPAGVPRVFKQLLQATCRTPRGWDTKNFGPGIVDARRLLAEPLPAMAVVAKLRDASRPSVAADTTGIETLVHLLPDVPRVRVETMASSLLHVPDRALPARLQEVGDELVFQLVMHPSLIRSWSEGAASARAATMAPPGVARTLGRAGVSRRLRKTLAGG